MPASATDLGGALPLTEIRDRLSEIVDDVNENSTAWVVTKHGREVAVILSIDEYESLVETLNILSDEATVDALDEADADLAEGRISEE